MGSLTGHDKGNALNTDSVMAATHILSNTTIQLLAYWYHEYTVTVGAGKGSLTYPLIVTRRMEHSHLMGPKGTLEYEVARKEEDPI